MSLLVTRPEPDATGTVARLRALDIEAIAAPLLERTPLHPVLPDPASFSAIVLTSTNALRSLAEAGAVTPYSRLPVFAVGDQTAAAAKTAGFDSVSSASGGLTQLAALLIASRITGRVFYPAAKHRSGDLAALVAPAGIDLVTVPVYRMSLVDHLPESVLAGLANGRVTAVLHYSRRTAEAFIAVMANQLDSDQKLRPGMLCLSAAIAGPLLAAGYGNAAIAVQPDEEAMIALALAFVRARNTP